jgi:hypothetical protein
MVGYEERGVKNCERQNPKRTRTKRSSIATDTRQQTQIETLTAALQKVSAQLEASKPAPQLVKNL